LTQALESIGEGVRGGADTRHDKTAFVAELVPSNRKLVEFSIEAANTPGGIAEVASILSKHKVNILTGFHNAVEWGFFADVTEIESSIDDIVKEISSLAIVSKVSLSEEVCARIIVDTLHPQLKWGPFRSIIMRADVMSSILNRIKAIFGPGGKAGKAIVFGMGEAAGRTGFQGVAGQLGAEALRSHMKDVITLYAAQGWGDFKLASLDLDRITASVQVFNSFECAHLEGAGSPSSDFTCDFVRGHLTGLFSEMFGKRVDVTETLCVCRGHSKCQFDVSSGVKQ
jgi:predicted hydrocarbon binding protein